MTGRPRQFRNAAEKQKAYRDRKKQDAAMLQEALILFEAVQAEKVTLQNMLAYWQRKGKTVVLEHCKTYCKLLVGGYAHGSVSVYLADHLLRTGQLEVVRKDWAGISYRICLIDSLPASQGD